MMLHDSRDPRGPGILILQHHDYIQNGFSLDSRGSIVACRVINRDDRQGGLGSWIRPKGESVGDLNLAFLWEKNTRPISGFGFAWPTVLASTGTNIVTGTGKCQPGDGPAKPLLPIFDAAGSADIRYKAMPFTGILNQSYPIGSIGITLAASDENQQIPLFFSADSRLFCPNRGGYANMGTPVHDLTGPGNIGEFARLQSFWRVQVLGTQQILAWQIWRTGCGGDAPGLVYAKPLAGKKGERLTGIINEHDGGPISGGLMNDKHFTGTNSSDGEPVNAVHIQTGTFFNSLPDAVLDYDGPLEFQKVKYVQPPPQPYLSRVHLRYDPFMEHQAPLGKAKGVWRWLAEAYFYVPSPCAEQPRCPGIPNQPPVALPPPETPHVQPPGMLPPIPAGSDATPTPPPPTAAPDTTPFAPSPGSFVGGGGQLPNSQPRSPGRVLPPDFKFPPTGTPGITPSTGQPFQPPSVLPPGVFPSTHKFPKRGTPGITPATNEPFKPPDILPPGIFPPGHQFTPTGHPGITPATNEPFKAPDILPPGVYPADYKFPKQGTPGITPAQSSLQIPTSFWS